MIKKAISAAIASSLIAASAITFAQETTEKQLPPIQAPTVDINPASPATFMGFVNPATSKAYFDRMANPAQWGQYMQIQYHKQMANPAQMAQWMNPASYQVMMNPATFMAWMQPNTMMNAISSVPATFMNPATISATTTEMTNAAQQNWFDMRAWGNMFQPAPSPAPQAVLPKDEG